jgi:uncharacterized protein (TIGR00297 family)
MNVPVVICMLLLIAVSLWISERASKKSKIYTLLSRKLLHVAGVGSLAVSPLIFSDFYILTAVTMAFSLLLFRAVQQKWISAGPYQRRSWGIAVFPLSFLILWLLWGKSNPALVILPMLVLTLSDAIAAIAGSVFEKVPYYLTGDPKSLSGSFSFFVATVFCLWLLPMIPLFKELPGWQNPLELLSFSEKLILLVAISLAGAIAEGTTSGGWDNLSVPLIISWLLAVWPSKSSFFIWMIPILMILLFLFSVYSVKNGWLNKGGASAASLLGLVVFSGGGWQAILMMVVFFMAGSLAGKLKTGPKQSDAKKGKPRDYMQVLSNGGIGGICMVWAGLEPAQLDKALFVLAVSVAISTADTLSSEIGMFFKGRVVDIVNFKPVSPGLSGGISFQGTLAGALGSGIIAVLAYWLKIQNPAIIFAGGFAGMLLDSILGSLFQVKYLVNGGLSDSPGVQENPGSCKMAPDFGATLQSNREKEASSQHLKGLKWVSNDMVNLLSNLIISVTVAVLWQLLWKGG